MKTETVDRNKSNVMKALINKVISRFLCIGLLLCFVFFLATFGQTNAVVSGLNRAEKEFDDGNFSKAVEIASKALESARVSKSKSLFFEPMDIIANSQINLGKYDEAEATLSKALREISNDKANALQKAIIYQRFAVLKRLQKKYSESFDYSKKSLSIAPDNLDLQVEYCLNIGRISFSSGFDVTAIIWLEKAEKLVDTRKTTSAKLDIYRFLSLAWSSKLNYREALKYAEKQISSAENSKFKFKYRQALFDWATVLNATGQRQKAYTVLKKGLSLSLSVNNSTQSGNFLTSLLLNSLYDNEIAKSAIYLQQLERVELSGKYNFEILLSKAVVSALNGQREASVKFFAELNKIDTSSGFIIRYWKATIAEKNKNWSEVIQLNQELLKLTLEYNFREDLPDIYFNFAKAYCNLNQTETALDNLEKSLAIVEEIRVSENSNLTLGIMETYHNAYRLLTQIKIQNSQESFELADFLKARFLKDTINNSGTENETSISESNRKLLEELSLKYIEDNSLAAEIEKHEKLITTKIPDLDIKQPDFSELEKVSDLENCAIVSYFFTLDKKLQAFVWEKGKIVRTIELPVSEDNLNQLATKTSEDIKNRAFFKRDGKAIFDKLLKPLSLTAKHLIIVPDKSIWKIPFQALSSDGEKYLIEEKTISYAPSVSILIEQLKSPKPSRQTLQSFANSNYDNRILLYVNAEATSVAEIYNSKPWLNATVPDFERVSNKTDILHFSMHAQVDKERPLESFLGFRKLAKDDGRLTVEEILKIKLKKSGLVFLASCDTNNVFSAEGLVSLAWAMMGSGATTVISAQWEASDKSTEVFTKTFYSHYKQGASSAEALQQASLELIKNKSSNMYEPYYWAEFTVTGDFR